VKAIEPLYYELRQYTGGIETGFNSAIYQVPDIMPSNNFLHYIGAFGIYGKIQVQLRYQAGSPRGTVGTRSLQRLDRYQAFYLIPYTFKFVIVTNDTLEVDVLADFPGVKAAIWFYGWKMKVQKVDVLPAGQKFIELEDVREMNVEG
jgi:hypothetical protein